MVKHIFAFVLASAIWACNTPKENNLVIENRVLIPDTPLASLFDSLRPATQTYLVKGDRDTLIVSGEGTVLSFAKNTFVNERGQPAQNVTINLVEATSFEGIIGANLQTISDNNILQTAGMFFIDAKENGAPLTIAEGKSIYVEVKAAFKAPDMGIFNGEFDKDGKINWLKKGGMENSLIPIPLNLLKFDGFYRGEGEDVCYMSETQIRFITNSKFENTFIATREFEERSYYLAVCGDLAPDSDKIGLLNIYASNLDKPLFYSDSLVLQWLEKDALSEDWRKTWIEAFKLFVKQHLTNVINFEKIGITSRTTIEDLVGKGYSVNEAERYIALFKTREQVLKDRKKMLKERGDAQRSAVRIYKFSAYTFSINKLGWANVDRFLDDARSQESTFVVQISTKNSNDSVDFATASLLIPDYGVVVSSVSRHGKEYSFTNKGGNYRKLPVGQPAMIFAFGYKNGKPYFGNKPITIPKDGKVELSLSQMNERQIKKEIETMVKN